MFCVRKRGIGHASATEKHEGGIKPPPEKQRSGHGTRPGGERAGDKHVANQYPLTSDHEGHEPLIRKCSTLSRRGGKPSVEDEYRQGKKRNEPLTKA